MTKAEPTHFPSNKQRWLQPIHLPCGADALIELEPMPSPDERGCYAPIKGQIDISVRMFVAGVEVEQRSWESIIGTAEDVILADGTALSDEDYVVLDDLGWEQMLKYGLCPPTWPCPPR